MVESLDIDKIMDSLKDPKVGSNAGTMLDMIKEVNIVLKELKTTVAFLDATGLKPLIVRAAGSKLGVDAETPLATSNDIVPATKTHKEVFNRLNSLNETELINLLSEDETEESEVPDDVSGDS